MISHVMTESCKFSAIKSTLDWSKSESRKCPKTPCEDKHKLPVSHVTKKTGNSRMALYPKGYDTAGMMENNYCCK